MTLDRIAVQPMAHIERADAPPPLDGLTQSVLFRPVVGLTALVVALAATLPDPNSTVSVTVVAVTVLVMGIPHGAVDHLAAGASYERLGPAGWRRFDRRFHAWYVAAILASLAVWSIVPSLALVAFIGISIHHFGQSDLAWCRLPMRRQIPLQWSRGLMLIMLPLVVHLDEIGPTVDRLGGGRPDEWGWLSAHSALWGTALIVQHVAVGAVVGRGSQLDGRWLRREAIGVAVLAMLFLLADPLIAFAVYFGLWHSLGHVLVLRQVLTEPLGSRTSPIGWNDFARLAAPRTLLSVVGIVGVLGFMIAAGRQEDCVAAVFVLVSVITVPHLVVVERLWRNVTSIS